MNTVCVPHQWCTELRLHGAALVPIKVDCVQPRGGIVRSECHNSDNFPSSFSAHKYGEQAGLDSRIGGKGCCEVRARRGDA